MKQLTFLELVKKVLEEEKCPLSAEEIWQISQAKGYDKLVGSQGKTQPATIGSVVYVDMRDNPETSPFLKVGVRPRRFALKTQFMTEQKAERSLQDHPVDKQAEKPNYKERDLHPFLTYFAEKLPFKAYTKTITHSKSTKTEFGEWVHPDIVGCYFSFGDAEWSHEVFDFGVAIGNVSVQLYSFELKRSLNYGNLREVFFQTVSNSSWANEGYLVAADISKDPDFLAELQRLSTSFGIGVIELDISDPDSTAILYPARVRDYLDWETINKLASMKNSDFREFLKSVMNALKIKRVLKDDYDRILSKGELMRTSTLTE